MPDETLDEFRYPIDPCMANGHVGQDLSWLLLPGQVLAYDCLCDAIIGHAKANRIVSCGKPHTLTARRWASFERLLWDRIASCPDRLLTRSASAVLRAIPTVS